MANPATVADIEARWRSLTTAETITADALLGDAWWLLLARRPTLEADILAGTVTEGNTIRVLTSMVLRVLRNPDGYSSETIEDYTYRRHELVASGLLHIDPSELSDLTPGGQRQTSSVRLVAHGDA